jgi:hypothetical protein
VFQQHVPNGFRRDIVKLEEFGLQVLEWDSMVIHQLAVPEPKPDRRL